MKLTKILRPLYTERERLLETIATLEKLQQDGNAHLPMTVKRRGRKSMSFEERQQVSARMLRYWARRRMAEHRG